MVRRSGFSLVELLIAMIVMGLVAGSLTTLLLSSYRAFREQSDRAWIDATTRQSIALFHGEFRALNTRDTSHPDILGGSSSSIVYRPSRTLRFLCRRPDTVNSTVTTWEAFLGPRDVRADLDSVLMLVMTLSSEYWIGGDLSDVFPGICPGGAPGVSLRVEGITGKQLAALLPGAPVLGGEISELKSYADSRGVEWLGMRRYQKDVGRWPAIQPVLGPLSPNGLEFYWVGQNGDLVTKHTDVARIRVRISPEAADPSGRQKDRETVVEVALRGRGSGK